MGPKTVVGRRTAALATALLVLAGCSSDDPEEKDESRPPLEERVSFEEVAMPASLSTGSRLVGSWSVVPQSGDLPRLAVTTVSHGKASEAAIGVWQGTGVDPLSEQGEIKVEGDVGTARVASDGELTAIAGSAAVDGVPRTFLLTSTDRATWEPVELEPDVAAAAAAHAAVSDGRIYLLGSGATGRTPRVAVHDTADGSTTVTPLPEPAQDEDVSLAGLAAAGQRVVAIADIGPTGDGAAPQVHVSDDGGKSFVAAEMGGDFDISGVVAAGEEFVATGSVRSGGYTRPAAWSSKDGRSWSVDDIVSLWEWDPNRWSGESADVSFTAPSYDPETDTVAAAVVNEVARGVYAATRDGEGVWQSIMYSGAVGFDATGRAMQHGDRISLLTTFNGGSAREASGSIDSDEGEEVELVSYEVEPSRVSVADLGDEAGIAVVTTAYIPEGSAGWRITSTTELYSYSRDDGLLGSDWGPGGLPEESSPGVATDAATGRTVLLSAHWAEEGFVTVPWVREESGTWTTAAAIDAADVQLPTAITHTEEGWLAALETEHGGTAGTTPRRAEIWRSPDGLEWTRQEGQFSFPDGRDSIVHAICDSAVGPVAVGSMNDAEGRARATAWRQVDGVWEPSVLGDTAGSWLDACVGTEDGVMVFGSDGAASGSWESADLSTFTGVDTLEEGQYRDVVVEVPGGYAAAGRARTEDFVGPVLWLSPDAREWTWVPLPVSTSDSTDAVVAEVGGDLLVMHPGVLRAWRVPDVASVLAE